jgi:hypothetical protein
VPGRHVAAALVPVTPFPAIDFVAMARRQRQCRSVHLAKASTSLQLQLVNVQGIRVTVQRGTGRHPPGRAPS